MRTSMDQATDITGQRRGVGIDGRRIGHNRPR